jgi:hypothetical protein
LNSFFGCVPVLIDESLHHEGHEDHEEGRGGTRSGWANGSRIDDELAYRSAPRLFFVYFVLFVAFVLKIFLSDQG